MRDINSSERGFHQIVYIYQSNLFSIIVVKTRRRADAVRAIFRLAIFLHFAVKIDLYDE